VSEPTPPEESSAGAQQELPPPAGPQAQAGSQPPPAGAEPSTAAPHLLRRSRSDKVIAGVCGGLGRYLGVDPVLLRIAFLVLAFVGGAGVVLYLIGWIAIPEEDEGAAVAPADAADSSRAGSRVFIGLLFVALGIFFLFDELLPDVDFLDWRYVGPAILIAIGLGVIARART
jgi:phage shock protein C